MDTNWGTPIQSYCGANPNDKSCPIDDAKIKRSEGLMTYISYLQYNGMEPEGNRAFDHWVNKTMRYHVSAKFATLYNHSGDLCEFRLLDARTIRPTHPNDHRRPLYSIEATNKHFTLATRVYTTPALFLAGTNQIVQIYDEQIPTFVMPIPVRSECCRTSELKCDEELRRVGHDPLDPGGYYIINGIPMIMPYIEKMRFFQINVVGPNKYYPHKVARQIFMTTTGTVLMQAVKHTETGECLLEVSAFGKQKDHGTGNSATASNMLNVINMALLIDYYYFTDEDGKKPLSEKVPIEIIFRDAVKRFMPKSDDPLAWNHIYAEFQGTVQFYHRTSRDKIIMDVLTWLDVYDVDSPEKKAAAVTQMIDKHIFPTAKSKIAKINMLANLTARLLAYNAGLIPATDMNKWSHRKLDTTAAEQAKHLRLGLTYAMKGLQKSLYEGNGNKPNPNKRYSLGDVVSKFQEEAKTITAQMIAAFKPPKYNEVRFQTTERLEVHNHSQRLSFNNKIHMQVFKKTKSMELRNVQQSQWFYVCPEHTPDNEQCGLVKYKTPHTKISIETNPYIMIERIVKMGLIHPQYSFARPYPVFVNGLPVGYCAGKTTQQELVRMRRRKRYDGGPANIIDDFTCIVFNDMNHLEIFTDDGRLLRPVYYVDNQELIFKTLGIQNATFEELLDAGCVGWIDSYEEEYSMMSASIDDIEADRIIHQSNSKRQREIIDLIEAGKGTEGDRNWLSVINTDIQRYQQWPIEYCSLHPISMYDITVSILVFNENQQPCRVSYGAKMATQAMTINSLSAAHESGRFLIEPTRPIVDTATSAHFKLNEQPLGKNMFVALVSSEYSQEDALELSSALSEQYAYVRRYKKTLKLKPDDKTTMEFGLPDLTGKNAEKYAKIGKNGFPAKGIYYNEYDCILGCVRKSKSKVGEVRDASLFLDPGEKGFVVDVIYSPVTHGLYGNSPEFATVILEDYREAEIGDKFSSREGQKYTVGTMKSPEDMPFITDGPFAGTPIQMLVNPHCIGSRMTAGLLLEMFLGTSLMLDTLHYDGTSHENRKNLMRDVKEILRVNGVNSIGTMSMARADTGEMIVGEIFSGPLFFMKLCHVSQEKMQGSKGKDKNRITKQAKAGKQGTSGGNIRWGEMEAIIALEHGCPIFNHQRMSTYSDAMQMSVCITCGKDTWNIMDTECSSCGSTKGFAMKTVNFVYKSLANSLLSGGIKMEIEGSTEEEYIRKLERMIQLKENRKIDDNLSRRVFEEDDDIEIVIPIEDDEGAKLPDAQNENNFRDDDLGLDYEM